MAHNEDAKRETHAEHQEPVLILRMVWVEEASGFLIEEDRLGLLERHLMLSLVRSTFPLVPLEYDVTHMYTVLTRGVLSKSFLRTELVIHQICRAVDLPIIDVNLHF